MEPTVAAALIAAIVSGVGYVLTLVNTKAKIDAAKEETAAKLAQAAGDNLANLAHSSERLLREFQLEFATETAAKTLLEDARFKLRTFDTLGRHLGGFRDDELRKLLLRAGAVRFFDKDGKEFWGLLNRNWEELGGFPKEVQLSVIGEDGRVIVAGGDFDDIVPAPDDQTPSMPEN